VGDRKGGRGKRGASATADRLSGGEAVEAATAQAAVGGTLDDVLPDVLVEELNAPARVIATFNTYGPSGEATREENRTQPGRKITVAFLRDRLEARLGRPVGDEEFKRALFALYRDDHIRLIGAGDRSRFTSEQLRRSVRGENETFVSAELNPSFYQAFPKAGKRR
jgi:hypothetical protein